MDNNIEEAFKLNGLNDELLWVMSDDAFDRLDKIEFKGHRDVIFMIASAGYSYRDVSLILNRFESQRDILQAFVNQKDYNDLKSNHDDLYFKTIAKRLESEQVKAEKIELDTTLHVIDPFAQ